MGLLLTAGWLLIAAYLAALLALTGAVIAWESSARFVKRRWRKPPPGALQELKFQEVDPS